MLPSCTMTVGLQMAAVNPRSKPLDPEQHAGTYGHLIHLPCLCDRIFLLAGESFIRAGRKLTSASLAHMELKEEAA